MASNDNDERVSSVRSDGPEQLKAQLESRTQVKVAYVANLASVVVALVAGYMAYATKNLEKQIADQADLTQRQIAAQGTNTQNQIEASRTRAQKEIAKLETDQKDRQTKWQTESNERQEALRAQVTLAARNLDAQSQKSLEATRKAISDLERLSREKLAQQDSHLRQNIATDDASIRRADLFAKLIGDISDREKAPIAILALWKLYDKSEEDRQVIVHVALHVAHVTGDQEPLDALIRLGATVKPYLRREVVQGRDTPVARAAQVLLDEIEFSGSESLSNTQETMLKQAISRFQDNYLRTLGYLGGQRVGVIVRDRNPYSSPAYYVGGTVYVVSAVAGDPDVILREYVHHVLVGRASLPTADLDASLSVRAVESGLATYMVCSYNNSPRWATIAAPALNTILRLKPQGDAFHNLENNRNFSELSAGFAEGGVFEVGVGVPEIWGGAFWQVRELLPLPSVVNRRPYPADYLLYETWTRLRSAASDANFGKVYAQTLIETVKRNHGAEKAAAVRAIFIRRGLDL